MRKIGRGLFEIGTLIALGPPFISVVMDCENAGKGVTLALSGAKRCLWRGNDPKWWLTGTNLTCVDDHCGARYFGE
jgi:hypothetical protein